MRQGFFEFGHGLFERLNPGVLLFHGFLEFPVQA